MQRITVLIFVITLFQIPAYTQLVLPDVSAQRSSSSFPSQLDVQYASPLSPNGQLQEVGFSLSNEVDSSASTLLLCTETGAPGLAFIQTNSNFQAPDGSIQGVFSQIGGLSSLAVTADDTLSLGGRDQVRFIGNTLSDVKMTLTMNSGRLGIGTTAPDAKLHVVDGDANTAADGGYLIVESTAGSGKNVSLDDDGLQARFSDNVATLFIQEFGGNTILNQSQGDVGIGTTNVDEKLHVNGNALVTNDIYINDNGIDDNAIMHYDNVSRFAFPGMDQLDSRLGVIVEADDLEESGIFLGGNTAILYSPGNGNRLFSIYDEDAANPGTAERWFVDGNGTASSLSPDPSEMRSRSGKTIDNALAKVLRLRGLSYTWLPNAEEAQKPEHQVEPRLVVVGAEVEAEFPELVTTNESGQKFVNYGGFAPVFIEAMKMQQKELEDKAARIDGLERELRELRAAVQQLVNAEPNTDRPIVTTATLQGGSLLHQNQPNPFSEDTTIAYELAATSGSAELIVANLRGEVLQVIVLPTARNGQVQLKKGSLPPGAYVYSLVVDGETVATKKMVLF